MADRRLLFLIVGGFNVAQGVVWFALFHWVLGARLPYLGVLVLAYIPAIALGFVLYRAYVFKVSGPWLRDLFRFSLVQAGAFLINAISLPFFHEVLGVALVPAQMMSVVVILVFNYVAHLRFSFRRSPGESAAGLHRA